MLLAKREKESAFDSEMLINESEIHSWMSYNVFGGGSGFKERGERGGGKDTRKKREYLPRISLKLG